MGRPAKDSRCFINAVFWVLRTGAPWRDRPPDYGDGCATHRRYSRWRKRGVWARLLAAVSHDPDLEWLMIDASHIKVHQHGTGAQGGQSGRRPDQRGLNTKLRLAADAHGMPVRMLVTAGTVVDSTLAEALIGGIAAGYLLADRGYDTNRVLAAVRSRGMVPVISPQRRRKAPQEYDAALYQARHRVENCFGKLKERRGVVMRYAREAASYLANCQIRALAMWAKII